MISFFDSRRDSVFKDAKVESILNMTFTELLIACLPYKRSWMNSPTATQYKAGMVCL